MKPTIEQVLARHTPGLMRITGVSGVGQALCDGTPCIRVYVASDSVNALLPRELEGFAVSIVVTDMIRPRPID